MPPVAKQTAGVPDSLSSQPSDAPRSIANAVGKFRWVICALLLVGVTKNYMDRQVLGLLKVTLQHDLGWTDIDYSNIVFAFQAAYAIGMLIAGRLVDRLGTRLGYALTMVFWSLAAMAHAVANSFTSFLVARFALGLGEAGVFPASIKTVAEWFLRKVHPLLSKPKLDYIKSDPQEAVPKVRWARLFLTGKPGPSQPALAARS